MVRIEFFLKGISVGKADNLKNLSNQEDRDLVAKFNGIEEYDEFVLDEGRTRCKLITDMWTDHRGRIWISDNESSSNIDK